MSAPATEDGLTRCGWADFSGPRWSLPDSQLYRAYHDTEWGVPLHGTRDLFERMSLEAFQSGLSWLIILRKRPGFRAAFAGFDPAAVAAFGDADRERLLADVGIVRNRLKIDATIANARAVLELDTPLDELLWSFAPERHTRPASLARSPVEPSPPLNQPANLHTDESKPSHR